MTTDHQAGHGEAEATRERLLEAAERLFAEKGYDGASLREITSAAGCNIAAVNYHFGGKENLYLQVFQRRLGHLRDLRISRLEQVLAEAGRDATPELVLSTFTTAFLEPLADESGGRQLMELMAREMLDPHLPRSVFVKGMIEPVRRSLAGALEQVTPGLDHETALLCVHSVVGQLVHVIHHERFLHGTATGPWPTEELQRLADHIARFSAGGVRALGRTGALS